MAIQILCKQPGFRRCGVAHPAQAVYPDGHFSPAQMAALKAEPMLVVTEIADETPTPAQEPKGKGRK